LAIRPIRHRSEQRVRIHVVLRMPSSYVTWHMETWHMESWHMANHLAPMPPKEPDVSQTAIHAPPTTKGKKALPASPDGLATPLLLPALSEPSRLPLQALDHPAPRDANHQRGRFDAPTRPSLAPTGRNGTGRNNPAGALDKRRFFRDDSNPARAITVPAMPAIAHKRKQAVVRLHVGQTSVRRTDGFPKTPRSMPLPK